MGQVTSVGKPSLTVLFAVRPATSNIGNDLIARATAELLSSVFGPELSIVGVPALARAGHGGFTAAQVYDMNLLADGVVLGGGNLFENGQLTADAVALAALAAPLALLGLSHGRVRGRDGDLIRRTDSMPPDLARALVRKATVSMVRDLSSAALLAAEGCGPIECGGCPSLFMAGSPAGVEPDGRVLLSIRHPERMSVSPSTRARVPEDVRRLIAALRGEFGPSVTLVCHDYKDIAFAAAFPDVPMVYFDDVDRYIDALRRCRLNVSYRLHAFLPCLTFGTPSIHLSYDERGQSMMATAGMAAWDVDLDRESDAVAAVMGRARSLGRFFDLKRAAAPAIERMREVTMVNLRRFADEIGARQARRRRAQA